MDTTAQPRATENWGIKSPENCGCLKLVVAKYGEHYPDFQIFLDQRQSIERVWPFLDKDSLLGALLEHNISLKRARGYYRGRLTRPVLVCLEAFSPECFRLG